MNLGQYSQAAAQPGIAADVIGKLRVPTPSSHEQEDIADFLDREIEKIDALVATQEQLIATLREDRSATITQAVTKGLDLDAGMKDSGVGWLGDIPRHWKACRLKDIIQSNESGTSVNAGDWPAGDDEIGVLKTSCVSAGWFNPVANKTVVDQAEIDRVTSPVKADSLIVNRANTPLLVGSAGYVATGRDNLFLSDKLWQVRFKGALAQYIYYWMQTEVYRSQIVALCVGASASMQNLAMTDFRNIALALPPAHEQAAVVQFLSDRTAKIDNLINKSADVIGILREYRSALITDAVTGKIDVRGAAA
jgi:type I restriction enzyme S subunit